MSLLILKLKLLLYLSAFVLNLGLSQAKRAKSLVLAVFVVFLIMNLLFFYFIKNRINIEKTSDNQAYSPTRPDLYIKSKKTEDEIRNEIIYWENVVEKQPNSRDALINLSTLKKSLLQNEEANKLWKKAQLIDPNNPIFKN